VSESLLGTYEPSNLHVSSPYLSTIYANIQ